MTQYTIALLCDDLLVATAPDGDGEMMSQRLKQALEMPFSDGSFPTIDQVTFIPGLTLYKTLDEAVDAGAEIVYRGHECGALEDSAGRMIYAAAGRV